MKIIAIIALFALLAGGTAAATTITAIINNDQMKVSEVPVRPYPASGLLIETHNPQDQVANYKELQF